jgi:ketosteroid isomerase-like protein
MNSAEMRALVDRYIEAYNRMDVAGMLLRLHPDVEFENISGGVVNASAKGTAELKELAEQSLALFAERTQVILSFESSETRAVASIGFHAVLADDFPNGMEKGQVLNFTGRSEFEFRDGAISKLTDITA